MKYLIAETIIATMWIGVGVSFTVVGDVELHHIAMLLCFQLASNVGGKK